MKIQRVFHPTDFSHASEVAFAHALAIAKQAGTELNILHVARKDEPTDWDDFPRVRQTLGRWGIEKALDGPDNNFTVRKTIEVDRDPVSSILDFLDEHESDVIVLATHQREGLARWRERAVALTASRLADLPTLFVPHETPGFVRIEDGSIDLDRILVPVDHTPRPQIAIDGVRTLVGAFNRGKTTIRFLYAGSKGDMPSLDPEPHPACTYETVARSGKPSEVIVSEAGDWKADLIVMATQGQNGFLDALRGSTTERVLAATPCPLLAVPDLGH